MTRTIEELRAEVDRLNTRSQKRDGEIRKLRGRINKLIEADDAEQTLNLEAQWELHSLELQPLIGVRNGIRCEDRDGIPEFGKYLMDGYTGTLESLDGNDCRVSIGSETHELFVWQVQAHDLEVV